MKKQFILFLAIAVMVAASGPAAASVAFPDTAIRWPSWVSPQSSDNTEEAIGTPIIFNGVAGRADAGAPGYLKDLTIYYQADDSFDNLLLYGDLFIDTTSDSIWDYVVRSKVTGGGDYWDDANNAYKAGYGLGEATTLSVYSIAIAENAVGVYKLSDNARTTTGGTWSGYEIRNNHPWALINTPDEELGAVGFDGGLTNVASGDPVTSGEGWNWGSGPRYITWDFSSLLGGGLDIGLENELTIGFTVNCANDVLYQPLDPIGSDIPEPAGILVWSLLGAGSWLGMRVWRRDGSAGRPRWSDENRAAIHEIIAHGANR